MKPTRWNRKLGALVALAAGVGGLTSLLIGPIPSASAATKVGGTCAKSQLGRTSGNLLCARTGGKYRWQKATPSAPPTANPPKPADAISFETDPSFKAAIETAIGGAIAFDVSPCSLTALKRGGCSGRVSFDGVPKDQPSPLVIRAMNEGLFRANINMFPEEIVNPSPKIWWAAGVAYVATTRPFSTESAYYQVNIALADAIPQGSPIRTTMKDRLIALARAVDTFASI